MTDVAELVALKLLGRVTTKDDDSWGELFWNSISGDKSRMSGFWPIHVNRGASCYTTCPNMPHCRFVHLFPDGTVVAEE